MKYLLDTNVCIAIIKERHEEVKAKLLKIPIGEIGISSIVLAELWYGVRLSKKREHNEAALNEFLEYVTVLDWPEQAAPEYGMIRAHLKKKGTPIGASDLLIVAHALALDAVLVTDNVREFERIPCLKMENWISRQTSPRSLFMAPDLSSCCVIGLSPISYLIQFCPASIKVNVNP